MDWYVSLNLFPWRNKFLYILSGWVHFFFNCNFWVNCSFKKRVYVFWAVVLCFVWVTVKNAYLKESGCLCKCAESPRLKQGPDLSKLIVHFWLHMHIIDWCLEYVKHLNHSCGFLLTQAKMTWNSVITGITWTITWCRCEHLTLGVNSFVLPCTCHCSLWLFDSKTHNCLNLCRQR